MRNKHLLMEVVITGYEKNTWYTEEDIGKHIIVEKNPIKVRFEDCLHIVHDSNGLTKGISDKHFKRVGHGTAN